MASFASKSKQFNPYTPSIDSEVYGKALAQKNTEYQEGVKKVDQTLSSIASLPVAKETDREYLQGVVDKLTSDVNQQKGTDWSDQHLQNTIATHATVLAEDPKIVQATASASYYKNQFSALKDDDEKSGGANVANKWKLLDQGYNKWANSGKVGDAPIGKYTTYMDADKAVRTFMKELKPDEDVNTLLAGQIDPVTGKKIPIMSTYDQIIKKYKGRDRDKVLTELNRFVETTPGLQDQLHINAEYQFKDFNGMSYAQKGYEVEQKMLQSGIQHLSQLEENLLFTHNPSKISAINDQIEKLKGYITEKHNNLNDHNLWRNKMSIYEQASEEDKDSLKHDMYMDNWRNEQADLYSSGREQSLTYAGEASFAKQMKWQEAQLKREEFEYRKRQDSEKEAKEKKESVPHIIDLGVNTTLMGNAAEHLQGEVNTNDQMLKDNKLRFMYDNMSPDQKAKYFKPIVDNKIILKSGTITDPEDDGSQISISSYIDNLYGKYQDAFNSGTYKNGTVQLNKMQINHFVQKKNLEDIQEMSKAKITRAKAAWDQHVKEDPETIKLYKGIDDLNNNPIVVNSPSTNERVSITGKDVELYSKIRKEIKNIPASSAVPNDPKYLTKAEENEAEILAKYGMTKDKYDAIPVYAKNIVDGVSQSTEDREAFLNNQVLSGSRLYRPQETMLTSGKAETNTDVIKNIAVPILTAAKKGGDKPYSIASAILSSKDEKKNKENIGVGYWFDESKNQYYLKISDGDQQEDVPITSVQAMQMHLDASNPYKQIEKKLDLNDNGSGSSNSAKGGVMTFENADPKGYINNGNYEVRAIYQRNQDGYYVNLYTKNINNPKEVSMIQLDPVGSISQAEEAISSWIKENKNKK